MAEHAHNKVALVQMGVLPCLVSLCKHDSVQVKRETARAFSLLSSAPENNTGAFDGFPALKQLLSSDHPLSRKNATMVLCNLTSHDDAQDHVARQVNLLQLFELMNDVSLECRAFATMTL
mmetsp:Transcript_7197/g.11549  ORF Transcript_7197/g.11549 Transcript_7197/m.11549 type:complete len:120 (-) Transcript_7197:2202-2561(-)